MNKNDEKRIVKIAEEEVKTFVKEWKKDPYLWGSETDIHAEIYMRIKKLLQEKFQLKKYRYEKMEREERLDWIYCEPLMGRDEKGKKFRYHPDIAIFRYIKNRGNPYIKDKLVWICEIKYATDWAGTLPSENVESDIRKLRYFLKRENGGAYKACYLILRRYCSLSDSVKKIMGNIEKQKGNFTLYHDNVGDKPKK